MIRHVVFFSVRDPADLDAVVSGLELLKGIPSANRLIVGRNMKRDSWSSEIDVIVDADFETEAALEAFKAHPLYAESIAHVRPKRELRFVADYQV
jgi:hypothetical protein